MQDRIKILYLTNFHQIGGGETSLICLIENLDRKKFEPIVVIPRKGQLSQKLKKLNVKTYFLNPSPYSFRTFFVPGASPTGIYRFLKLAKKIKPNLIHLNHLNLVIYAGICAKILKIPVVATCHGSWDSYYFYQDILSTIFVDKILANTASNAQILTRRKIIPKQKVIGVPFGIDTEIFNPASNADKIEAKRKLTLPTNSFVVTIVGRLDPVKDHLTYLKAAKIIAKKIPNAIFFIVGSQKGDFSGTKTPYFAQIREFLKKEPALKKRVVFGGFIDQMTAVYNASDVLLSTSHSESFGLALAEAAACGLPIVSTNTGGQRYIVKNNKTGFLAPPQNPQFIARKILILAKNPKLRRQFGQNGRKHIIENFSIEKYVGGVESIYLQLLKSRNEKLKILNKHLFIK